MSENGSQAARQPIDQGSQPARSSTTAVLSPARVITLAGEIVVAADLTVTRSAVRRRILSLLAADPPLRLHLREIQRRAGTSPGTASRELGRLEAAGLIQRTSEGHQVYFQGVDSPMAAMLRSVLLATADSTRMLEAPTAPKRKQPANRKAAAVTETAEVPAQAAAEAAIEQTADPRESGLRIARQFASSLRGIYADRLRGAYLYGSRATGAARADSNVDVLVALDRIDRYGDELERTSATCAALSLETGLVVSRVFVSEKRWQEAALAPLREKAVSL